MPDPASYYPLPFPQPAANDNKAFILVKYTVTSRHCQKLIAKSGMAKPNHDRTRYQLQIIKQGFLTYFYGLNNVDEYEVHTLQLGVGQYEFRLIGVSKSG